MPLPCDPSLVAQAALEEHRAEASAWRQAHATSLEAHIAEAVAQAKAAEPHGQEAGVPRAQADPPQARREDADADEGGDGDGEGDPVAASTPPSAASGTDEGHAAAGMRLAAFDSRIAALEVSAQGRRGAGEDIHGPCSPEPCRVWRRTRACQYR